MSGQHVSSFEMDLLSLDGLPAVERERVNQHLATCARCRHEAETNQAYRAHFEEKVAPRGLSKSKSGRRAWLLWLVASPALAVAIALLVVKLRPPALSIKGGPTLTMFVRHDGQVSPVREGQELHANDEVRFVVVSEELPYLLIASVDGTGKANVYYPFGGAESGTISLRTRVELPGSIVLDEAPGPERIFALFTAKPIPAADVTDALEAIGSGGAQTIRATHQLSIRGGAQITIAFEKAP